MANKIQIKRGSGSSALSYGELGFNKDSNLLYIGREDGQNQVIGGEHVLGGRNLLSCLPLYSLPFVKDASGAEALGELSYDLGSNSLHIINTNSNIRFWLWSNHPVLAGETYTVSCWVASAEIDSERGEEYQFQINLSSETETIDWIDKNDETLRSFNQPDPAKTGWVWKVIHQTFTVPTGAIKTSIAFRTGFDYETYTNNFFVKNFKIERSHTYTDWSPAPEDTVLRGIPTTASLTIQKSDPYLYLYNTDTNQKLGLHWYKNTESTNTFGIYDQANSKHLMSIKQDGTVTLYKALPVASGGTGATTAAAARTNLGITPTNIGALALSGGTITGMLQIPSDNLRILNRNNSDTTDGGHMLFQTGTADGNRDVVLGTHAGGLRGYTFVDGDYQHLFNVGDDGIFMANNFYTTGTMTASYGRFTSGTDADPNSNAAVALRLGSESGVHIDIDNNEILAKNDTSTLGTLYLQSYISVTDTKISLSNTTKSSGSIDLWIDSEGGNFSLKSKSGTHSYQMDGNYDSYLRLISFEGGTHTQSWYFISDDGTFSSPKITSRGDLITDGIIYANNTIQAKTTGTWAIDVNNPNGGEASMSYSQSGAQKWVLGVGCGGSGSSFALWDTAAQNNSFSIGSGTNGIFTLNRHLATNNSGIYLNGGNVQFNTKNLGLAWTATADGTSIYMRPYQDSNIFQLVMTPSGGSAFEAFGVATDGTPHFYKPVPISYGGTGATTAAGARANLYAAAQWVEGFTPAGARNNTLTDLLQINLDSQTWGDCDYPCWVGTEGGGLSSCPVEGVFYAYREVRKISSHQIMVTLTESYPRPGRVWTRTYDKNFPAWLPQEGWACNETIHYGDTAPSGILKGSIWLKPI